MRKVLLLTTALVFILTSSLWAADLSGTWTVKMSSPMGSEESFDLVVKDAGGNLTITGTHPQLQAMAGTGTVKGDDVTMDVKATGQMAVEIVFTGKVAGNTIKGTRDIKMSGGGQGGPGGGASGASGASGAPGGAPGGQGGAPAGDKGGAPAGGQGGAPAGGAQGGAPAGGAQGGAPGGQGGAKAEVSNAFTAVKK